MSSNNSPTFVIALEDPYSPEYNTLHTLSDRSLWEWLHMPVSFPDRESRITIPIPGTGVTTEITRGSAENDRAQALMSVDDDGGHHPLLTEIDFENYETALNELTAKAGADNVYTGLWY